MENLLKLTITEDFNNELTLKITDSKDSRFTLPYKDPFGYTKSKPVQPEPQLKLYDYKLSDNGASFSLEIFRIN